MFPVLLLPEVLPIFITFNLCHFRLCMSCCMRRQDRVSVQISERIICLTKSTIPILYIKYMENPPPPETQWCGFEETGDSKLCSNMSGFQQY